MNVFVPSLFYGYSLLSILVIICFCLVSFGMWWWILMNVEFLIKKFPYQSYFQWKMWFCLLWYHRVCIIRITFIYRPCHCFMSISSSVICICLLSCKLLSTFAIRFFFNNLVMVIRFIPIRVRRFVLTVIILRLHLISISVIHIITHSNLHFFQ